MHRSNVFCLLLLTAALAPAETWHVSLEPLSAVREDRQFRTIQDAVKNIASGDTVVIHSGVYRESVVIEKSGTHDKPIRFEAATNANVIVSGLDRLSDWHKE